MAVNIGSVPNNNMNQAKDDSYYIFGNNGNLRNSPIARNNGSENVTQLRDAMAKYYADVTDKAVVQLVTVEDAALAYSVITLCFSLKANPTVVSYLVMILEQTGKHPDALVINENGTMFTHPRVVADAFDNEMLSVVTSKLQKELPKVTLVPAGAAVIYRDQETFVKNTAGEKVLSEKFKNFLYKAINIVNTDLDMHDANFNDINLAETSQRERNNNQSVGLLLSVRQERQLLETDSGLPIRSDVSITFKTKRYSTANNNSLNNGQHNEDIGRLNGFVDLVNVGSFNGFYAQPTQVQQRYAARLVLTALETNIAFTPAAVLLIMSTCSVMSRDNNWATLFKSKMVGRKEMDFTDIGALGIENNLTPNIPDVGFKHIDTKSDSVTPSAFAALVSSLIRPGLIISMDVIDRDIDSSYLDLFALAANNDKNKQKLCNLIMQSANQLTGGAFAGYFNNPDRIFTDTNNRVQIGHYIKNGERRDIRDIDYVAVANYASATKDPSILTRWAQTFNDSNVKLFTRLHERTMILKEITGDTFTLTGYATRVTFSGDFINALVAAISNTNISVDTDMPITTGNMTSGVSPANFVNDAISNPNIGFLNTNTGFNNGRYSGVGMQNNIGNRFL